MGVERPFSGANPKRLATSELGKVSDMNKIMEINARMLEAEEQDQAAELEKHLTEDFFIVRSTGQKLDRQAFLADVPSKSQRGRQAWQPEVRLLGNCAIYTCIVTTTQNPDGTPNPGRFWNTRLFVQQDGHWRCAAWQVTKVSDG